MAGSVLKNFDPARLAANFGGIIIGGWAAGTFLKVVKNKPDWTEKVGATGEIVRVKNNDNSGYAEFTLQQSSSTNDALSQRRKLDNAGLNSPGVFSLRDNLGTSKGAAEGCFIAGLPDQEWADEAKDRTWRIIIPDVSVFDVGGNTAAVP